MLSIYWPGPAEVKYVALGDGEAFKSNLINLRGLHFYGGSSNIKVIEQYMACLIPHKPEREKKLAELFLAAFSFVNEASSWQKISALAEYIRYQPIGIISCVDMGSLLDSDLPPLKIRPKERRTSVICCCNTVFWLYHYSSNRRSPIVD